MRQIDTDSIEKIPPHDLAAEQDGVVGKVDLYFDLKRLRFFEVEDKKIEKGEKDE